MQNNTSSVSFRVDRVLKQKADSLFAELGLNMSTAFKIFLRQSVREHRIPFDVALSTPNNVTLAAMLESERLANNNSTTLFNVEDALKELKK